MYRDIINKPEQIECSGKKWWIQVFCKWDGNLAAINLYDENGDFVDEFTSMTDLEIYLLGMK